MRIADWKSAHVGPRWQRTTDYETLVKATPPIEQFYRGILTDFDARRAEHYRNRSSVMWAEKINVPLLILQGGADAAVPASQALALAQKLEEQGKLYELVVYAGDNHPVIVNREDRLRRTIDWFKNPRAFSIRSALARTAHEQGAAAAVKRYHDLKRTGGDRYDFGEPELNRLGYELLGAGRVKDAVEIFKLNVEMFPEGFNTYDSLGEAYAANGDKELAIKNYKKSLELNPQNTNARDKLKELERR